MKFNRLGLNADRQGQSRARGAAVRARGAAFWHRDRRCIYYDNAAAALANPRLSGKKLKF